MTQSGDRRRRALTEFMEKRGLRVTPWAKAAGISHGTLRNFLKGVSDSLTAATMEKLAEAAKASVSEMMGESEAMAGNHQLDSKSPQSSVDADALTFAITTVIRSAVAETQGYIEDEHVSGIVERIVRIYGRATAAANKEVG